MPLIIGDLFSFFEPGFRLRLLYRYKYERYDTNLSLMRGSKVIEETPRLETEKPIAFFDRLKKELGYMSQEKELKLFGILDKLLAQDPQLSPFLHLEIALNLLPNVENSFVEMRGIEFFRFLFEKLISNKPLAHSNKCIISPFIHSVDFPFSSQEVLGLLIEIQGIHGELKSIKSPFDQKWRNIHLIEGSSFMLLFPKRNVTIFYFEIQKKGGKFSEAKIKELKSDIYDVIQELATKETFEQTSLDNYEFSIKTFQWIMKDLKENDLPHVFIDLDQRTYEILQFSALVCRIRDGHASSLEDQLENPRIHIEWKSLEKGEKFCKEGVIFKVELPASFYSVVEARQQVAAFIQSLIGPFRDINGGLIEKAEENFYEFTKEVAAPSSVLREFFFSISPEEKRATFPSSLLGIIYLELDKYLQSDSLMSYGVESKQEWTSVTIKMVGRYEKEWKTTLMKLFPHAIFSFLTTAKGIVFNSFLLHPTSEEAELFQEKTLEIYNEWKEREEVKQVLNLCADSNFSSFDPRRRSDEEQSYLIEMLFEGLMRKTPSGDIEPAIAENVEITNGGLHYRFFLRKSLWSNGMPLTAHDFVYSWQKILTPGFLANLSYLFYRIKNAQEVKEGILPPSALGVKAINDYTLEVILTTPTFNLLEASTLPIFSPICQAVEEDNPSWSEARGQNFVCNGPFCLDSKGGIREVTFSKNPLYWEHAKIKLSQINLSMVSEKESLSLYKKKHIDALLFPLCSSQIASPEGSELTGVKFKGPLFVRYICLNCAIPPFSNKKVRQCLSFALDRKKLLKELGLMGIPHYTHYSSHFSTLNLSPKEQENRELAQTLFHQALHEDPSLKDTIYDQAIYTWHQNEHVARIFIKQINETLGLKWQVFSTKEIAFYQFPDKKRLTLFMYGWIDRINDPGYFLNCFASVNNPVNVSLWSSMEIQTIIKKLEITRSHENWQALHLRAEEILLDAMPMIPLFSFQPHSLCFPSVEGIHSSRFSCFDVRHAYKK